MSIEQALAENTAALNTLAGLLKQFGVAAVVKDATTGKKSAGAQPTAGSAPASTTKPAESPAKADPEVSALEYPEVSKAIVALAAAKGKDVALGIIGNFKTAAGAPAKAGKELQAQDYPAVMAAIGAASAEEESVA